MKFVDTNVLLSHLNLLEEDTKFLISSITIEELEDIKSSNKKTDELKCLHLKIIYLPIKNILSLFNNLTLS